MVKIQDVKAREILDSRGNPTLETSVFLFNGASGTASVPSGASTGKYEAYELFDGDKRRFHGHGVIKAMKNVSGPIAKTLQGASFSSLKQVDERLIALDGSENKSRLGANAILSVSLASARAFAASLRVPLYRYLRKVYFSIIENWRMPRCMFNVINGGVHAAWSTDFQEYMIVPRQHKSSEQVRCGSEVFQSLKQIIANANMPTSVGDEGGFALLLNRNVTPFDFLKKAAQKANYAIGRDVDFAIDAASSEFYRQGKYQLKRINKTCDSKQMISLYNLYIKKYPLISIEDGLAEDDWEGWKILTSILGKKILLVGDDIFATNRKLLEEGIAQGVANAILIKPNQIGTVTETAETINVAQKRKYSVVISHRSGETQDSFVADLAVACGADFLKAGSVCRGERVAKWNRLVEIEEEVSSNSKK